MQVAELDAIVVDDGERAHAAEGERDRGGRADAARADEHDPRRAAHVKNSSRLK